MPSDDLIGLDELAAAVGMTRRNIRAYVARGIVPPPTLRGRTGYYGPEHLARLTLARDLHAEGFTLAAVQRFLSQIPDGTSVQTLALHRVLRSRVGVEAPERMTRKELNRRYADGLSDELTALLEQGGIIVAIDAKSVLVRSPALVRIATRTAEFGVPPEAIAATYSMVMQAARTAADAFVELFREHVWRDFTDAGMPAEQAPSIRDSADTLLPFAAEAMLTLFNQVMASAVADGVHAEVAAVAVDASSRAG